MKNINKVGISLLVATIFSGPLFFSVACAVGEADTFGVGGALYYSWFVYFGVAVAAVSAAFALWAKKRGYRHKKNVVVSCIFIPVFLLIGSERYLLTDLFDYDNQIAISVNEKTGLSVPLNERIVTIKFGSYNLATEKIVASKREFDASLDTRWADSLRSSIADILPSEVSSQATSFNYFLFYDCVSKDFNKVTAQGEGRPCVYLAYSTASGKLMILNEYRYKA